MGQAIIKGLLVSDDRPDIYAYDVAEANRLQVQKHFPGQVFVAGSNKELVREVEVILLAVKPQVVGKVLDEIVNDLDPGQLLLSIAAGVPLKTIEAATAGKLPVVRIMPNTPALVQKGMSALAPGSLASRRHMALAAEIFSRVGKTVEVNETLMDAVTAVSGSGPAYVFLVIEAMLDAAVGIGLNRDLARKLVIETVLGSTELVKQTGKQPMELKDMVTSPGGTTIAGLAKLEENGLRHAFNEALKRACRRSQELGK
jgi:pyrroline-5-carboxylate reductase